MVGGGAAGLHAALCAAETGATVTVIARKRLKESSSYWAQGGLAAAVGDDDSPELHASDTIAAGRGACDPEATRILAEEAPLAVAELEAREVEFDREPDGSLSLALEGGHSRRRIVHAGGAGTGRWITERLAELAKAAPSIDVREGASVTALWSGPDGCAGVICDDGPLRARATLLATGGAAALWRRTTNPRGAIGAGMVMAHAAGAELTDLEFCQFHPTALNAPGSALDGLLITEAVRGEGGELLDSEGRRFIDELAPRDEVTKAILATAVDDGAPNVFLDMREIDPERFPNIFEGLAKAGFDARSEPVPVLPAAHYAIGGIRTDLQGRTSVPGLYAVGECACTGLHGANRLASNSLSECLVFGRRAALASLEQEGLPEPVDEPEWRFEPPSEATRDSVWADAGPLRDEQGLTRLLDDPYPLARLIARFALERSESRGCHQRTDHPETDPKLDGSHLSLSDGGELTWSAGGSASAG